MISSWLVVVPYTIESHTTFRLSYQLEHKPSRNVQGYLAHYAIVCAK